MRAEDLGLLTYAEAAQVAGVDAATIRQWVRRYDLRTVRFGGRLHLLEREVLDCERDRRRSRRRRATRPSTAEAGSFRCGPSHVSH